VYGSVEIDKVNHARTIAKATVAGLYTFRISVNCDQGTASQEVTHEILPGANANAGLIRPMDVMTVQLEFH
jgi:hypothetical protein